MESNRGALDSHPFQAHCEPVTISHTNLLFLVMALEPSFLGMVRMPSVAEQQRLISHITVPLFYCTSLFHIHHTLNFIILLSCLIFLRTFSISYIAHCSSDTIMDAFNHVTHMDAFNLHVIIYRTMSLQLALELWVVLAVHPHSASNSPF